MAQRGNFNNANGNQDEAEKSVMDAPDPTDEWAPEPETELDEHDVELEEIMREIENEERAEKNEIPAHRRWKN